MLRALSSFTPSILILSMTIVGCGPAVKTAGHTANPALESRPLSSERLASEKTQNGSSQSDSPADPNKKSAPPPQPARKLLFADVPEGGQLIGDAGPIALEDWGPGGHWVAHCSLPPGTKVGPRGAPTIAPQLHLTLAQKTESIDALLASDSAGRYLVVLIANKAWLIDALENRRLDLTHLGPDLRFDSLPSHRSFAFTQNGLALLSGTEGKTGYFVPLSEKTDFQASVLSWAHPIEFGARPVWRLEAHGLSFAAVTLPEGYTEKSWPAAATSGPNYRCQSPGAPYHSFERVSAYRPDRSLSYVWTLSPAPEKKVETIKPVEAPGFVFGFRDGWVRREDSGRLLMVRGKTQEQIASERCGARVLHADEKSGLFLIACEEYTPITPSASTRSRSKPKYRFDLYLIRPGFVRSLQADTARTGVDLRGPTGQRLIPIRPGATAALVDFKKRALVPLEGDLQVVLASEAAAILRRGNELRLWNHKGEENIDLKLETLDTVLTTPYAASINNTMLSLGDTLRTWKLPAAPLAISDQGYALVPKQAPQQGQWPAGPLLLLGPPDQEERASGAPSSAP